MFDKRCIFMIFSDYQDKVYKDSAKFLDEIVLLINSQTVELEKVTVDLKPAAVSWNFTVSIMY